MEKIPNKHELWLLWEQAEGLKYGSPQIKKKKKILEKRILINTMVDLSTGRPFLIEAAIGFNNMAKINHCNSLQQPSYVKGVSVPWFEHELA